MLGYRTDRRIESVGEMTEDYKDSYLHDRIRERWGSMSADKRAAGGHDYVLKNEYGQDVSPVCTRAA